MIAAKKSIVAVLVVWAVTATVSAGVIPASRIGTGGGEPSPLCAPADLAPSPASDSSLDVPLAVGLDGWPVGSLPVSSLAQVGPVEAMQPLQVFADEQSSLHLCLCVLMGLGLCRSVPFVKKLSLGFIPDWYHTGAPAQVGHSHAIAPDLDPMLVVCFVQPDSPPDDLLPEYHRGTIASLVRESLFTPNQSVPRGPPSSSC